MSDKKNKTIINIEGNNGQVNIGGGNSKIIAEQIVKNGEVVTQSSVIIDNSKKKINK